MKSENIFKYIWNNIKFPLFSIFAALLVGAVLIIIAGHSPIDAYKSLLLGSFGGIDKLGEALFKMMPLLFTGLSFSIAFRTGLFNIGGAGQFLTGSIAAIAVGWFCKGLPHILLIVLIMMSGMIAGAIWASISGFLKAKLGVHEVITTIMLNYIGLFSVNYIVATALNPVNLIEKAKLSAHTVSLTEVARLTKLKEFLPFFGKSTVTTGIFIAIVCALVVYYMLFKTTLGYELRSGGNNPDAAEYGGIKKAKNIIMSMAISGAIAGLGGAVQVMSITYNVAQSPSVPSYGFDGIAVGLVGKLHPIGIIASSFLFGVLQNSARKMQLAGIPKEVIAIIQGVIIIFIASEYIIKYINKRKKKKNEDNEREVA